MTAQRGKATKGSQQWLQLLVNDRPDLLRKALGDPLHLAAADQIRWVSPLRESRIRDVASRRSLC